MFRVFIAVAHALRALFRSRFEIAIENAALRQQLAVLNQRRPRPRLRGSDRLFWVLLRRVVPEQLKSWGVKLVRTAWRSPWQNGVAERWIASVRREALDHVIVFNETQLRRLLDDYVGDYNQDRCHLALEKDAPEPREVQPRPTASAKVVALPRVGGIHHRYEWTAPSRFAA